MIDSKKKNETKIINDIPMIISCSTFIIPSVLYLYNDYIIGFILFFIVTFTSVISDGIYENNLLFDKIDKIFATICYIYAVISVLIPAYYMSWYTFFIEILIVITPLLFIYKSRKEVIRSEKWRRWHISWHYCASGLLTYSIISLL